MKGNPAILIRIQTETVIALSIPTCHRAHRTINASRIKFIGPYVLNHIAYSVVCISCRSVPIGQNIEGVCPCAIAVISAADNARSTSAGLSILPLYSIDTKSPRSGLYSCAPADKNVPLMPLALPAMFPPHGNCDHMVSQVQYENSTRFEH